MVFRICNAVMTLLFAVAVAVQYNDPDPVRWMAIYGAAGVLSARAALGKRTPVILPVSVAAIAVVWSLDVAYDVVGRVAFLDMFQAWEMKSPAIEEARESSGLLIVAGWMGVLAVVSRLQRRQGVG
jgi:hypothetical protein